MSKSRERERERERESESERETEKRRYKRERHGVEKRKGIRDKVKGCRVEQSSIQGRQVVRPGQDETKGRRRATHPCGSKCSH